MKINKVPGVIGAYQQSGVRKASKGQEVARPGRADEVQLSKEAQEVRALKEKLSQVPEVRMDRVEELRRQIEAGTYSPSGRDVVAKMLKAKVFDERA